MKKVKYETTHIYFILPPHCNLYDFAGAMQVFTEAIDYGLDAEVHFCSYAGTLETSFNMPLGNIDSFSKYKPRNGDYIFIVSASINYMISDDLNPGREFISWVNEAFAGGVKICSICNGAFLLGKTGLLDGRKCTTHWKRTAQLQKKYPHAEVQDNILFIEDDGIITSAGGASGVDVALHILAELKDDYLVYKVSRELVVYCRRSGSDVQQSPFMMYRNHVHSGIHRVQDWLQNNLHKSRNIPELAEIAMMSERNFTRVFKKETQLTVNEYITLLRKEKIKELLSNPNLSRSQIAYNCGLRSERQISRIMKAS